MASLQELLAKKKAAAAETPAQQPVSPDKLSTVKSIEVNPTSDGMSVITKTDVAGNTNISVKTIADPVNKEEPAVAAPKALSFAEKMALKKKEAEAALKQDTKAASDVKSSEDQAVTTPAKDATTTPSATIVASVEQTPNDVANKLRTGMLDASLDPNSMPPPDKIKPEDSVDPQIAQAYADIKERIEKLNDMSDADLPSGMSSLKKALMANPAACSLMEDSDIGRMVIALRKITGEAIAEASKEKKPGRKAKTTATIDLTNPDVVAQVFDEL